MGTLKWGRSSLLADCLCVCCARYFSREDGVLVPFRPASLLHPLAIFRMLSPHNEVPFWETFSGVADGLIDCQFADDLQPESSHALNKRQSPDSLWLRGH